MIFNGFDITKTNNYFSKITISNKELFQSLLNSIWNEISDEIPANTFNIRWKILDLEQEKYLYKKGDDFSLRQMGFSNFQTLIIIKII